MANTDTLTAIMPSATPDAAEQAAWNALPRDVQLQRLREHLAHQDCSEISTTTMSELLDRARQAAKPSNG